jgi:hypothetical protein
MITQPLLEEIVRQRTAAGWHLVSLEWRRELPEAEAPTDGAFPEDIPYGLRISEDCKRLEIDPNENQAMLQMMEMLVQDFPFSAIVSDLNEKGFRTRDGRRWSPVAIFNMIPRLIEVGPRLFSTEEWEVRRQKFARMT